MPGEVGDGLAAVPDLAHDRLVAIDDLAHARLDPGQVVQGERLGPGEVVIEAVLDVGADGHLGPGKQLLDRLGQHMGGVVADDLQGLGAVAGDDLHRPAARQRTGKVEKLAVKLDQQGLLGQRRGDRGGDLCPGHAIVELAVSPIGKFQIDHLEVFRGGAERDRSPSRRRDDIGTGAARPGIRRAPARAGSGPRPHSPNRSAGSGTGARSRARASPYRPGERRG